jgi:MoaA/NifB/PqqE/SkfB family radical SAM enzyme
MVEHACARGIRVGFNTNATLLTRRAAERLIDAGLDWLCVSLDGATAATYESIRDGARLARVARNVRGLVQVMRERHAARPALSIVFVAMRRNVAELPALVALAAAWGVPAVRVQNLSHSFSDTDPFGAYREIRAFTAEEALWPAPDAAAEAAFAEAARADGAPGCDWPWRSAYGRHDGGVQPCCMLMGGDRAILGDATRDGLPAVWRGERYEAFRAALTGPIPPDVCAGCAMYRGVF